MYNGTMSNPQKEPMFKIQNEQMNFINAVLNHETGDNREINLAGYIASCECMSPDYRAGKYSYDIYDMADIPGSIFVGKYTDEREFVTIDINDKHYYMEKTPSKFFACSSDRSISVIENGHETMLRVRLSPDREPIMMIEVGGISDSCNFGTKRFAECNRNGIYGLILQNVTWEILGNADFTIDGFNTMCKKALKGYNSHLEAIFPKVVSFFADSFTDGANTMGIVINPEEIKKVKGQK